MTALQRIASQHRLKIRLDECGDPIIPGKRGHLYFDGPSLCLMVTDGPRRHAYKWEALGGKLWLGEASQGVQDVKIAGLPEESIKAAIHMIGCKAKRVMSDAQKAVLARAQESSPLHAQLTNRAVESPADRQVIAEQDDGKVPW